MQKWRQITRGVTLVEALVSIGIIALLFGLALPVLMRVRDRGREAVCLSNLHGLGTTVSAYVDSHGGAYPFVKPTVSGLGVRLPPAGPYPGSGGTRPFPQLQSEWPWLLAATAPWDEHFESWTCPGSPRVPGRPWRWEEGAGGNVGRASYNYSLSFVASPRLWSGEATRDELEALIAPQTTGNVKSPSQKVLMWDAEMAHVTAGSRDRLDQRPMLFADGHAAVRRLSEAAAPAANPLSDRPHRLSHTPWGIHGRDY